MKFQQLSIGERFEYDGAVHVKVGPLVAREQASGRQHLIPRYALLRPLAAPATAAAAARASPGEAALDAFHARCLALIAELGLAPERAAAAREALAQARLECLARLRDADAASR